MRPSRRFAAEIINQRMGKRDLIRRSHLMLHHSYNRLVLVTLSRAVRRTTRHIKVFKTYIKFSTKGADRKVRE